MQRLTIMMRSRSAVAAGLMAMAGMGTACIPYTVGTTARPVQVGERSVSMVTYAMPSVGILDSTRSPRSASALALDWESRLGIDSRSDVGIRVTSASGMVVNYKRLLSDSSSRALVAIIPGGGIVNMAQHAHFELTVLVSGWEPAPGAPGPRHAAPKVVPYGGLRVMQVAPIAEGAVHDDPTAGLFMGVRLGSIDFGVSPEIGVFYDRSALGVRNNTIVVVPAISVHGDRLIDAIRGRGPRRPFFQRNGS